MTNKPPFDGEVVRLGDVCEINPKAKRGLSDDDVVSFLPLASVHTDGGTELGDDVKRGDVRKGHPNFKRGDILLAKITPSFENGKIAIAQIGREYGYSSTEFHVIRPKKEMVNTGFLMAFLRCGKTINYCAHRMKGSAGQKRVPPEVIKSLKLPLPQFAQQEEIANRFASITDLIAIQDTRLARFDSLVKSRFVEMFSAFRFGSCRMGDLLEGIVSGTNVSGKQRALANGEYAVLKISAVTHGVFKPREYKVVEDVAGIKMVHPHKGDLLFSRANTQEMVGATAIVDNDYDQLFLPDKLWRLDLRDGVETAFAKYLLSSTAVRAEISKVSTGTSGSMKNISMAKFRQIPAFLPPHTLQQEFADFAAYVDKLRVAAQKQKDELQALYDSLAQDYFAI